MHNIDWETENWATFRVTTPYGQREDREYPASMSTTDVHRDLVDNCDYPVQTVVRRAKS